MRVGAPVENSGLILYAYSNYCVLIRLRVYLQWLSSTIIVTLGKGVEVVIPGKGVMVVIPTKGVVAVIPAKAGI